MYRKLVTLGCVVVLLGAACSDDDTSTVGVCGNGLLDEGEACDDGNAVSGDGCNATCTAEEYCGNGIVDTLLAEQCDDGNIVPGDGCDASCQNEGTSECGNSEVETGEQCDDGNTTDGDGCSSTCQFEIPVDCGNGDLDGDEECDDGNNTAGDGCSPICTDEICGNGTIDPGEQCDDGNTEGGDGCSADCSSDESCGNGILDSGEGCDDANTTAGDGCSDTCTVEVTDTCGDSHLDPWEGCDDGNLIAGDGCDADCLLESCGNGNLDAGEGCDDGNTDDTDDCPRTCRPASCGDTFVRAGVEECDDGNNVAGDGCSPFCILEICGNGMLDPGEGCDDANADNTDSCASCQPATCSDGYIHAGFEMCDDGNTAGGDGCSADCLSDETCGNGYLDAGEVCDDGNQTDTDACPTTCLPAVCGDNFVWSGHETCDDGNTTGGDGCSATCVLDGCGSGTLEGGEECDEGMANGSHGSSCFANCISTVVDVSAPFVIDLDLQSRGQGPRDMQTADFNGDGRPDLITANYLSYDVTVLYGLGDGRFWAPHIRSTGSYPHDVKVADLNGDGNPDAVTVNRNSDSITVLLGNGNGFDAGDAYSIVVGMGGDDPRGVAIAELTGDAHLDVVTANYSSDNVSLLTGDGNGGFTATTLLSTMTGPGGDGPIAVAVADVTNDGIADIVTANRDSDDVTVLAGLGSGNFSPAAVYTTRVGAGGDGPEAIALADVSGDTVPDVVTANYISDDITVLTADSVGGLNSPVRFLTLDGSGGGVEPSGVAVADVNGDGEPDVITANLATDDVSILTGVSGGAAFNPAVVISIQDTTAGNAPRGIAVADFNGDTVLDIITSNTLSDDLSVLLGQGGGAFAPVRAFESSASYTGTDPRALAVADVNGDGALDVVTSNEDTANISVVVGLGDGLLAPAQTYSTGSTYPPRAVATGDLDGDGDTDWVAAQYSTNRYVRRGLTRQSGDFQASNYYVGSSGYYPISIALGDIDSDLDLDWVTGADANDNAITMLNDGGGSFSNYVPYYMQDEVEHVALADVTGDGNLDILAVSPTQNLVIIRPGTGAGAFGGASSLSTAVSTSGQGPVWVTVADVTDDNVPDILTANSQSNDVTLMVGLGSGSFNSPIIIPAVFLATPANVSCVRVGHFNDDAILDLATANADRDTVSIILGFGNGDYAAPQSFPVGLSPYAIAVDDFDGDGKDDIAAADYDDGTVTVLLSLGHL